ncbi:MAG: acyclic terpene utilization AtuA family protein [Balneolales bacterium]
MKKTIRIASGQGFWGDLPKAPVDQVKKGDIDYLMMDYLAEVTMSILQKQKNKNPLSGYAPDFVEVIKSILPEISGQRVRVVSNAGGVNPLACKEAILEAAGQAGYEGINVAVVDGDDILDQLDDLQAGGHTLNNMDTGEPIAGIAGRVLSANVYFGAAPIVEALEQGADIVVTGRVTDTGLCLGPMIHEFGWSFDDYDKMAAGTIAGHILECGAQSSGGNYTDWQDVDDFSEIGFPIVEARSDGSFVITKHENTGGLINLKTVKEQLLYEIGDPTAYITPDCVADFTSVRLEGDGKNRVKVTGIKGMPKTPYYKVSVSYDHGYKLQSGLVYAWPDAMKKARKAAEILQERAQALKLNFTGFRCEYVGFNGCNEHPADQMADDINEIQLRISASSGHAGDLNRFGREIAPLILTGPSGVTGFAGGRPKASSVVAYWPALIKKEACEPRLKMYKNREK